MRKSVANGFTGGILNHGFPSHVALSAKDCLLTLNVKTIPSSYPDI